MKFLQNLKYSIQTKCLGVFLNILSIIKPKKAGKIAYEIFSNPRQGKLKTYTNFLSKAKLDTIIYKEHQIQTYEWTGEKDTILLIHGWESNSSRWQGMIQFLKKKKYCIISLDAPAQGLSSGKELNAVLYSEFINEVCKKFKPSFLIGHSLGGMTMFYAQSMYQFPYVKKIVGIASPNIFNRITTNYKKLISLNDKTYQTFLDVFVEKYNIETSFFNTEDFIEKIKIPVLVMHDETDSIVPFSDAEKIYNKNPNINFISTKGYGHSMVHNQIYKQVVSFLEKNSN